MYLEALSYRHAFQNDMLGVDLALDNKMITHMNEGLVLENS